MGSTIKEATNIELKDESTDKQNDEEIEDLEWSADQEILLLYSLHGYKPVGPNKHFRMLIIQDRLSSALKKNISAKAIWKKLNSLYDLEALDEAEAEADATVAVEVDFSLPEDEFGELMTEKLRGRGHLLRVVKQEADSELGVKVGGETLLEVKEEPHTENEKEVKDVIQKGVASSKENKKEISKRGTKKKDQVPSKDNTPSKKDSTKEISKKDTPGKKEVLKDVKKGASKEDEKKESGKKSVQDVKRDLSKDEKKEAVAKTGKRDSADKKVAEQIKKDEVKKTDQKKAVDVQKSQRTEVNKPRAETPKQLRTDTPKKTDTKASKSESPKLQKAEATKSQRVETVRKDLSAEKKKDSADKKTEGKSSEKTPESARGAKLRARDKKELEPDKPETPAGSKRERSRDSTSKAGDGQTEEHPQKKLKTLMPKGRPTRHSLEPQQKPASPAVSSTSPHKRRTRV